MRSTIKQHLQKTETASMSLEAALILPLLMLIFLQLALSVHAVSAELSALAALRRLSKESNLILSAQLQLRELHDTEEASAGTISTSLADSTEPASTFAAVLKDAALTTLSASLLAERLSLWFSEIYSNQLNFSLIEDTKIFLQTPQASRLGRLHLFYRVPGLWEDVPRSQTVLINDWRGYRIAAPETEEAAEEIVPSDIWSWDNFSRGKTFQEKYGANLSAFHPVVARAEGGHVTMIKSINLLASSYRSGAALEMTVDEWFEALSAFNGTAETGTVNKKSLLIIVPENSPYKQLQILENKKLLAGMRGIALEIVKDSLAEEP